jgi:hypothetical protein
MPVIADGTALHHRDPVALPRDIQLVGNDKHGFPLA